MFEFPIHLRRMAVGTAIMFAVGISCLGIVRVQRFAEPAGGVSYKCSTGAACVEGDSAGAPDGVEGLSKNSNGVFGLSSSTTGSSGVAGESNGKSGTSYGVFGSSSNGPGVYGLEANYYGVEGVSTDSDGVYGLSSSSTSSGVLGESDSKDGGYGVYGSASYGDGVYGTPTKAVGVYGDAPDYGVEGVSVLGYGVYGTTSQSRGAGVYGTSNEGFGVYGQSGSQNMAAVAGESDGGVGTLGETTSGTAVAATAGSSSALIFDGVGPGERDVLSNRWRRKSHVHGNDHRRLRFTNAPPDERRPPRSRLRLGVDLANARRLWNGAHRERRRKRANRADLRLDDRSQAFVLRLPHPVGSYARALC
jgi:hypothetical protein